MKLEEIQELWSSDSIIDDTELDAESTKIPETHNKYLKIFSEEKLRLVRLDSKAKELKRLKWLYYTGKLDEQSLKNLEWDVFDLDVDFVLTLNINFNGINQSGIWISS